MKETIINILEKKLHGIYVPYTLFKNNDEMIFLENFLKTDAGCKSVRKLHVEEHKRNNIRYEKSAEKSDDIQSFSDCTICGKSTLKKSPTGTGENGVMIILNAPMLMKSIEKREYRVKSIEMLKNIVTKGLEFDLQKTYITNIIKCESTTLLNRPSEMFNNCKKFLIKEIEDVSPRIIIVMGDNMPLRSIIKSFEMINWYNIDHPITLLKHPEHKQRAWSTIKEIKNSAGK